MRAAPPAMAAAFGAALLLWAPVSGLGFLSDDFQLRFDVLRAGPLGTWSGAPSVFFRPLASASLWVDQQVFGGWTSGWHLESLAWHAGATALVGLVARRVGVPRPALVALLFGVLGAHLEAVAWIAARGDLLCTVAALLALLGLLNPRPLAFVAGTLAFAAALASKEAAFALPLVGWVLVRAANRSGDAASGDRGSAPPMGPRLAVWGVGLAIWAGFRTWRLGTPVGGYGAVVHLEHDPLDILVILTGQLWHALVPPLGWEPTGPVGWVLLLALAAVALKCGNRLLIAAFLLSLLPVWGLRLSLSTGEGGRFVYLPSAFAAMALSASLPAGRRGALVLGLACVVNAAGVRHGLGRWQEASDLAERLASGLASLPEGRSFVLAALPDSVQGAYVFREGAEAVWRLAHPRRSPLRVTIAGYYVACRDGAPPLVVRSQGWIAVTVDPTCARFIGVVGRSLTRPGLALELPEPSRLRIRADEVWAWNGTEFASVP